MPEGETPAAARPSLLSRLSSWRAPAEPQTMEVHAPEGSLGLQFARDSTVLSRIYDTSPLLNKVQVGWTLVSVDGQDVSRMNGWQVTKLLTSRVHDPNGRRLSFTTGETPPVAAGEVLPEFEAEGEQPTGGEVPAEPEEPDLEQGTNALVTSSHTAVVRAGVGAFGIKLLTLVRPEHALRFSHAAILRDGGSAPLTAGGLNVGLLFPDQQLGNSEVDFINVGVGVQPIDVRLHGSCVLWDSPKHGELFLNVAPHRKPCEGAPLLLTKARDYWKLELVQRAQPSCVIAVTSAGWFDGNSCSFKIDSTVVEYKPRTGSSMRQRSRPHRGFNFLVLEADGKIVEMRHFDLWGDDEAPDDMKTYVKGLARGTLVLVAVKDEGKKRLTEALKSAMVDAFGTQELASLGYRESYAAILIKDCRPIDEQRTACHAGPAVAYFVQHAPDFVLQADGTIVPRAAPHLRIGGVYERLNPPESARRYSSVWADCGACLPFCPCCPCATEWARILFCLCPLNKSMLDSPTAWAPTSASPGAWIQIDLKNGSGVNCWIVAGIIVQGCNSRSYFYERVTQLSVSYKRSFNSRWEKAQPSRMDVVGSKDKDDTHHVLYFDEPVVARYVRVEPMAWNVHPTMRCGFIARPASTEQTAPQAPSEEEIER